MEGFKSFKKVQCFKDGGSVQKEVNFTKRDRKIVDSADLTQDKKVVKKAFSIHDTQQHEEKTDLKGLKKGGRAKKEVGTVKKYKTGGVVENAYAAKKTDKDIKDIADTKRQKPALLCGGKSVKKMAAGGPSFETDPAAAQAALDTQDNIATRNIIMNPARKAKKYLMDKLSGIGGLPGALAGQGAVSDAERQVVAPGPGVGNAVSDVLRKGVATPGGMKKGGKACK